MSLDATSVTLCGLYLGELRSLGDPFPSFPEENWEEGVPSGLTSWPLLALGPSTYFSASSSWETPSRRAASRSAHLPSSHPASCCKGRSAGCQWRGTKSPPGGADHISYSRSPGWDFFVMFNSLLSPTFRVVCITTLKECHFSSHCLSH